jgi:hypothetical protein
MEARDGVLKLTPRLLGRLGVSRWSSHRGLKHLEFAGLIKVSRHRGRCPLVQITYPEGSSPDLSTIQFDGRGVQQNSENECLKAEQTTADNRNVAAL